MMNSETIPESVVPTNLDEHLKNYNYPLPRNLIAAEPAEQRDGSRLMRIHRGSGAIEHRQFVDLPQILQPGDLLVLNQTRVLPARLVGKRVSTGGRWEGLYLRTQPDGLWRMIGKTRGHLQPGETVAIDSVGESPPPTGETLTLTFVSRDEDGWLVRPESAGDAATLLAAYGTMPLPPYLRRDATPRDFERYQTIYAQTAGALAAPTAGLHFTPAVLAALAARGVQTAYVTLHVGLGTFKPISAPDLVDHVMHSEWCQLPAETAAAVNAAKSRGKRVIAVGTTVVRTLEAASAASAGEVAAWEGETNLFLRPPYTFRVVDALLTNFHLPESTLLILVSAFWNRAKLLSAYRTAIAERYRFFSYGDAMLLE